MSAEEVMALVEKAKAAGLRRLRVGDVELEFAPAAPLLPDPKSRSAGRPMPTSTDFLMWSTGEQLSYEKQPPTNAERATSADASPGKVN